MRRRLAVTVVLAGLLAAREAAGETIYHLKSPSTLETEGGSTLRLPPGYFLDEEAWRERDERLKQAENDRTRYRAENLVLRTRANDVSWRVIAATFVAGVAVGAVALQMTK